MSRTRLGFIGSMAAYLGFTPKVQTLSPPTGAISADGAENYIGGAATISALDGSATISTISGLVSGSVFGGSIS